MNAAASAPEFVKVDLRGLKGALIAHARRRRVTISYVLREAIEEMLSADASERVAVAVSGLTADLDQAHVTGLVKVWIRLTSVEVVRLQVDAQAAGLSRSVYVGRLLEREAKTIHIVPAQTRSDGVAALVASNSELASIRRNVRHLADLLRGSQFETAQAYRAVLDTVADDIKRHLEVAGQGLDLLQLSQRPSGARRAFSMTRRASDVD